MTVSPYLPLALAVLFVSFGSILVRLAQAPPLAVSFYRIFLAALCLAPFAFAPARRAWGTLLPRQRAVLLAAGAALALHFATWVASLSYTSIASSVLLVNTAPLFAVGLSRASPASCWAPSLWPWGVPGSSRPGTGPALPAP